MDDVLIFLLFDAIIYLPLILSFAGGLLSRRFKSRRVWLWLAAIVVLDIAASVFFFRLGTLISVLSLLSSCSMLYLGAKMQKKSNFAYIAIAFILISVAIGIRYQKFNSHIYSVFGGVLHCDIEDFTNQMKSDFDYSISVTIADAWFMGGSEFQIEQNGLETIVYKKTACPDNKGKKMCRQRLNSISYNDVNRLKYLIENYKVQFTSSITFDGYILSLQCMDMKKGVFHYIDLGNADSTVPAAMEIKRLIEKMFLNSMTIEKYISD